MQRCSLEATYFGVIESTNKWIEESHPNLGGHWVHFLAGAIGTLSEFLRESFREKGNKNNNVVSNLNIESKRSSVHEVREN